MAGTTNRMLAPHGDQNSCRIPRSVQDEVAYTVLGNPVRRELVAAGAAGHYDFSGHEALRLLVLGGSLGARRLIM